MIRGRRLLALLAIAMINMAVLLSISTFLVPILMGEDDEPWGRAFDGVINMWRGEMLDDAFWIGACAVPALVVTLTQVIFVLPLLGSRPVVAHHGKPLVSSIVAAALIAGALCVGLLFALAEMLDSFEGMIEWAFEGSTRDQLPLRLGDWLSALWPWAYLVPSWIMWSLILMTFARRSTGRTRWGRWIGLLLGGTVLETLIIVPMDVIIRRRTDCYCSTGSFFALIISMWALLWLTGPGILIAATSRRRRLWSETRCRACGQEKGPSPGPRCPECGCDWMV